VLNSNKRCGGWGEDKEVERREEEKRKKERREGGRREREKE
jgi:hypothetical protein